MTSVFVCEGGDKNLVGIYGEDKDVKLSQADRGGRLGVSGGS